MKIYQFIFPLILFFFTATCRNTDNANGSPLEITGTIQEQGMTSYQYGTHTLTNDETFYAIRSEKVDLSSFLDREVTVVAEKIDGYPLEGGPEYLLVLEVRE